MSPLFLAFLAQPCLAAPALDPSTLEAAAMDTRLESIQRLEALLKGGADFNDEQRATLLFRLAELTYEHARALNLNEIGTDAPATESVVWRDRAIKRYRLLLSSYPSYARADEATWYLGQTLTEAGKLEEGQAELTRLVKIWPQSAWVPDAFVLIGEYQFDKGQALTAMAAYQRAKAYADHDKQVYAQRKYAWCLYNLGEPTAALDELEDILARAAAKDPRALELREEVINDYARFYVDSDKAREGTVSRWLSKAEVRTLTTRVADLWFEQGKFEQALATRRHLIADAPDAPDAFSHADAIVEAQRKLGRSADAVAELEKMDQRYGPGSAWAAKNPGEPSTNAKERMAERLRRAATDIQVAKVARDFPAAERAYTLYLARYADDHAVDVHYALAELLYRQKRFGDAYDHYVSVVRADPKGKNARFCAESAVFAAAEMVKRAPPTAPAGNAPAALTEWEQKQLAALDLYVAYYDDAKVKPMIYTSAWLLYQKNQFAAASERFTRVIQMDPSSREAEQAANLILDSLALVEDWGALERSAKVYSETEGLGSAAFRKEVRGVYANARFKGIEARLAADGDKVGAARAWLAYATELEPNADLALHNAGFYLADTGNLRESMAAREQLVSRFPRSKYTVDAIAALGFAHESIADFGAAAARYEQLATLAPEHTSAPDALYSAGVFRAARGEWQAAVADWQRYTNAWPDRANVLGVRMDTARVLEENGKLVEASAAYKKLFDAPVDAAMYARLRYGLLLGAPGQSSSQHWQDSLAWYKNARSSGDDGGVDSAAQMLFLLAEPQYQAFLALALDGPAGRTLNRRQTDALLKQELVAKVEALRALEATYTAIVDTGSGEWGIAALTRLGGAYEDFGQALDGSYVPDYLTPEQMDIYELRRRDLVYNQNQRALASYHAAVGRAHALNVYNERSADASRRIAALEPESDRALYEQVPAPRFVASAVVTARIEE